MRKIRPIVLFLALAFCFSTLSAFAEGRQERQDPAPVTFDMDTLMRDVSDAFAQMDEAFRPSLIEMTMEDEYYLGRAVAAKILRAHRPYTGNPALTAYLNKIALAITINSPKPSLFSGYRVEILDTDEIHAFATPGGHIFISRGLINLAPSEDALAAIIAHEVAHIQLRHIPAILANEQTVQDLSAVAERAASIASRHLTEQERTAIFQVSVTTSINVLFRDGFSQGQELEADREARLLLINAGYDPAALEEMLRILDQVHRPGNLSSTHPPPSVRIANLRSTPVNVWRSTGQETLAARRARFNTILGR